MPVPETIADLSTSAASNSPAGTDTVSDAAGPDEYFRAHAAIIKTLDNRVTTATQALYPVGSIYINAANATNPATLLGFGTWAAFGAGRVPVGINAADASFDTLGETGGSKDAIAVSHSHTASSGNQSADHTHAFSATTGSSGAHTHTQGAHGISGTVGAGLASDSWNTSAATSSAGAHTHTVSGTTGTVSANHSHAVTVDAAGASGTNANLQPYVVVHMWQRTA